MSQLSLIMSISTESLLANSLLVGTVAGILTSLSMLPQLIKMIREKKAEDVSTGMLIVLICGVGLWVYYGLLKKDFPVLVTNAFSLLLDGTSLFFSIRYKKGLGS